MSDELDLETLWGELLSRDASRVRAVWRILTEEERIAIRIHLEKMVTAEGWLEPQRVSARAALAAIALEVHDAPGPDSEETP